MSFSVADSSGRSAQSADIHDSVPAGGELTVLGVAKRVGGVSEGVRRWGGVGGERDHGGGGVLLHPDHVELVQRTERTAAVFGKGTGLRLTMPQVFKRKGGK